jgi:hypothetical protein
MVASFGNNEDDECHEAEWEPDLGATHVVREDDVKYFDYLEK